MGRARHESGAQLDVLLLTDEGYSARVAVGRDYLPGGGSTGPCLADTFSLGSCTNTQP